MAESNDRPPYRHWHVVCAACSKITLARPCKMPGQIEPVEHNPVVQCQYCKDSRQYLTSECFLAPLSVAGGPEKTSGTVAVVAGLIAAVKLARVDTIACLAAPSFHDGSGPGEDCDTAEHVITNMA
jgi:hypothetical protein